MGSAQIASELERLVTTAILPQLLSSDALVPRRDTLVNAPGERAETGRSLPPLARDLARDAGAGAGAEVSRQRSAICSAALPDTVTPACVEDMVDALLALDSSLAFARVQALQTRGLPDSQILLEVLTPAARHLGALWEDDRCDFLEVSISLGRLEDIVGRVAASADVVQQVPLRQERCLLLPAPGESHLLGVAMVETFFAQAGWHCERGTVDNFLSRLRRESFDVVGFSLSCSRHLDSLRTAIVQCRDVSKNPGLIVLVGGPLFEGKPELGVELGADATAVDASSAVALAQNLLRQPCDV